MIEALQRLERQGILPTGLSAAELDALLSPQLREAALFSAKLNSAEVLQEIADILISVVDGNLDRATALLRMNEALYRHGYQPQPGEAGTLLDHTSRARRLLILEMQESLAQNYGQHIRQQAEELRTAYPAQKLIRGSSRLEPRNWLVRWGDAQQSLGRSRSLGVLGREEFLAPKGDPVWPRLSRFGLPYPPFDYNSGMILRPVRRDKIPLDAEGNSVMPGNDYVPPADFRPMTDAWRSVAQVTYPPLRTALEKAFTTGRYEGSELVVPVPVPPMPTP